MLKRVDFMKNWVYLDLRVVFKTPRGCVGGTKPICMINIWLTRETSSLHRHVLKWKFGGKKYVGSYFFRICNEMRGIVVLYKKKSFWAILVSTICWLMPILDFCLIPSFDMISDNPWLLAVCLVWEWINL